MGGSAPPLGSPVGAETAPTSSGLLQRFAGGSIYWSAGPGAHEVHGAIRDRYQSVGGPAALGYPLTDETTAADGAGRYNDFQGASVYWSPASGAYEVHGAIRDDWSAHAAQAGYLGYPVTNEIATPFVLGRYNHFQGGSVYWSPASGAHEVHGAIRDRWASLGWENGLLGFPVTDENSTPAGFGRYNHFQNGSVYWSPASGSHEVHGAIRDRWASLGWENGFLGFPVSDEFGVPAGRQSNFQNGALFWNTATGVVSVR